MKHHLTLFFSILLAVSMTLQVYAHETVTDWLGNKQMSVKGENEFTLVDIPASGVKNVDTAGKKLYLDDGTVIKYSTRHLIKATAYCHCQKCCGKAPGFPGYGYTASGINLLDGFEHKVVAAPKGWDFGTELYLVGVDGSVDYGFATVEDRGGAIKGSRLDVYYPEHNRCLEYGIHSNVYAYEIEWVDYTNTVVQ